MKKIKIISLLATLLLSVTGYGQLKVESSGKVLVGPATSPDQTILELTGEQGPYFKSVGTISLGVGLSIGSGLGVDLVGNRRLRLHGDDGFYFTAQFKGGGSSFFGLTSIDSIGNSTVTVGTGKMAVNKLYYTALYTPSDERYKKEVSKLSNSLSKLSKLEAISYRLDLSKSSYQKPKTIDIPRYGEYTPPFTQVETDPRKRMGFSAQELEKVFPELVSSDDDGNLYVDYVSLIPVIIEAMKELQVVIEDQSKTIAELVGDVGTKILLPGSSQARSLAVQGQKEAMVEDAATNAFLYQNEPNPFSQSTQIRYFLPGEVQSAFIYIFNMQGALIKSLPAGVVGSLAIEASELAPGMYIYSLIADGKEVDSKRMIVTE